MKESLEVLRKRKRKIDNEVAELLDKRAEIVKRIGKEKRKLRRRIINNKMEREIIKKVTEKRKNKEFVKKCFEKIIIESRKLQKWKG